MKHVIMYSGGAASYVAAKRVIEWYGKENVILLFADTQTEDKDLYRFLKDSITALGLEITIPERTDRYKAVGDIWGVFEKDKFIAKNGAGICSDRLKITPCDNWIKTNFLHPESVTVWVGIDIWEAHRLLGTDKKRGLAELKLPYIYKSPLLEKPYLLKKGILAIVE